MMEGEHERRLMIIFPLSLVAMIIVPFLYYYLPALLLWCNLETAIPKRLLPTAFWKRLEKGRTIDWHNRSKVYWGGVLGTVGSTWLNIRIILLIPDDNYVMIAFGFLPFTLLTLSFFALYYSLVYVWREPFVVRR